MQESVETMDTELEEWLRFETDLAETPSRFINLPADRMDDEIEGAHAASADSSTWIAPHSGKSLSETPAR